MPAMPEDTNSWVNLGLNQHPTFFGCSADARPNSTVPIIIYVSPIDDLPSPCRDRC